MAISIRNQFFLSLSVLSCMALSSSAFAGFGDDEEETQGRYARAFVEEIPEWRRQDGLGNRLTTRHNSQISREVVSARSLKLRVE